MITAEELLRDRASYKILPVSLIGNHGALVEGDHTLLEHVHYVTVVRDEQESRAQLVNFEEEVDDALCGDRVKIAGWFVGDQEFWAVDESTRDRNSLLLAAGERLGIPMNLFFQPDNLEHLGNHAFDNLPALATHLKRKGDILTNGLFSNN